MKPFLTFVTFALCLASSLAHACDYSDDTRLSGDQWPALLEMLSKGHSVPPVRIRVGTYLKLGETSRKLLEPHLSMFDVNCNPVSFKDGELLSRPVIPFEEFYQVMAQAIQDDRPQVAQELFKNARVAPMNVKEVQKLFGMLPYPGTGGLAVREKMQYVFKRNLSTARPLDKELHDPLRDGRPVDYTMFKLFMVFGGTLRLDKGCGPYSLDERFYRRERIAGLLGNERDVLVANPKPFLHIMRALGQDVTRVDDLNYRMTQCY